MDRSYIEVPGAGMHELPPLLVRGIPEDANREDLVQRAAAIIDPRETPHAPSVSRLVSTCSPRAAGSAINPITRVTAPKAIIQLPVRDDIVMHL